MQTGFLMEWIDYSALLLFILSSILLFRRKKHLLLLLTILIYINDFAPAYSDYWNIWLINIEYLNELKLYSIGVLFIIFIVSVLGRFLPSYLAMPGMCNEINKISINNHQIHFFCLAFLYLLISLFGNIYYNSSLWYLLFMNIFFSVLYKNNRNFIVRVSLVLPMLFLFYGAYQRSIIIPIIIIALYLAKDKIHTKKLIFLSFVVYILYGVALVGRAYVDTNINFNDIVFQAQFFNTILANLSSIAAGTVAFEMKGGVANSSVIDYFICAIIPLPTNMLTSCNFSLMSVSEYLGLSNIGIPSPAYYEFSLLGIFTYYFWFLVIIFIYRIEITEFDIHVNPIVNGLIYVSALVAIIYLFHSGIRLSISFLLFSICLATCWKVFSLISTSRHKKFS